MNPVNPKPIFLAPTVDRDNTTLADKIAAVVAVNVAPIYNDHRETAQRVADHNSTHAEDVETLHARIAEVEARGVQAYDVLRGELHKAHTRIAVLEGRWSERFVRWVRRVFKCRNI